MATQCCTGGRRQDRTATKGQDAGELGSDLLLEGAERRLTIVSEDLSNRLSGPLYDDRVDIAEGDAELVREHGSDSALARAGGTYQDKWLDHVGGRT